MSKHINNIKSIEGAEAELSKRGVKYLFYAKPGFFSFGLASIAAPPFYRFYISREGSSPEIAWYLPGKHKLVIFSWGSTKRGVL